MMVLGCCDSNISQTAFHAYEQLVEGIARVPMAEVRDGGDKLTFKKHTPDDKQPMTVRQVQQALSVSGFFPGGAADAICGYRTLSAIRLFQEYVRTVEKLPCDPDGRFGPQSQRQLKRWTDGDNQTEWAPTIEGWKANRLSAMAGLHSGQQA